VELQVIHRAGYHIQKHLDYEQALFRQLRGAPGAACLFYVCDPCIVLGRNNRSEEWVDAEAARADGVPVVQRFSGGGTVYLDRGVLNYSFIMPRMLLDQLSPPSASPATVRYINFFRGIVIRALNITAVGFSASGTSDVSFHGRKVSGNAQRIASNQVLHHGTLMVKCPLAAIERYLPLPPDRPNVPHADFITGLAEEGLDLPMAQLKAELAREYHRVIQAT
jgi:lipoate-protein ligase A